MLGKNAYFAICIKYADEERDIIILQLGKPTNDLTVVVMIKQGMDREKKKTSLMDDYDGQ